MADVRLYENDDERVKHAAAIRRLASELCVPEREIKELYETILQGIKNSSRIKDYIVILVSRQVKNLLESRCPTSGSNNLQGARSDRQ